METRRRDGEATSSETLADLEDDEIMDEEESGDETSIPSPDGEYDDEEDIED